jgi:hypothetical protein
MSKYNCYSYYLVDDEGYTVLTVKTQFFATEEGAAASLKPVLAALTTQYGRKIYIDARGISDAEG